MLEKDYQQATETQKKFLSEMFDYRIQCVKELSKEHSANTLLRMFIPRQLSRKKPALKKGRK